jgi:microcin C transport system substrate-binding protein
VRRTPGGVTRRGVLAAGSAVFVSPLLPPLAWAAGKSGLHGLSVFGELKYPPGFKHFDYVNPNAPKGGRMNFQPSYWVYNQAPTTFNTLNSFVLKGDAPPRMEMTFDSLMTGAEDEPNSYYGLVAETVDVSEDGNAYTFHLRDGARFHDGSPLTAEDVAFSLRLLKDKGHPDISQVILPMKSAAAGDTRTVVVTLDGKQTRETIFTIAGLPIFSKAYYANRAFDSSTLDPPLGSGAYKVGNLQPGRFVEYEGVADYWGKDLPVNVGQNNFDVVRVDFFQERETAFEAFKKGAITYREEFTAITWATGYNFPAFTDGRVKKTLFPAEKVPSLQGLFFNMRKGKFADPRTRQAIALAFDFEWENKNLFFDSYAREFSYFQQSDFMAEGKPGADEAKLLEPYRANLPPEVFTDDAYVPPKTDGSGNDRAMLKRAFDLLAAAGWQQKGGRLVDQKGETLDFEFLIDASIFERVLMPWVGNLKRIGVRATIRQVDPAQYQARLNDFDFDAIMIAFRFGATPLDGMNEFFATKAADTPGSHNYAGIRSAAVDGLIGKLSSVTSREELTSVLKALDRVLRAGQYWVPSWYQPNHRVAHWDIFDWPATAKPDYAFTPETTWWFDSAKAAKIGYSG